MKKKYAKLNHEIFFTKLTKKKKKKKKSNKNHRITRNLYLKKVTPYSEKNYKQNQTFTLTNKTFTPNLFFFNQIKKKLLKTLKLLHQIRNILNQTVDFWVSVVNDPLAHLLF